jgi:micrococcal nuclease
MSRNKISIVIITTVFIAGGFWYMTVAQRVTPQEKPAPQAAACGVANNTVVTKIIDGDTLIVEGGYHIRLLGIDTDEKDERCYESAKERLQEFVLNKQVVLEKDKTDVDKYGRCLRTVFLGGENIGVQMVREGLAVAWPYKPDVKYKKEISNAEKYAIDNKLGCKWSR